MQDIACIQVGPETETQDVVKKEGFTTNENYLGHTQSGIPIYYNKQLKQGEIKTIMASQNTEFKQLNPGKYNAKCLQVYEKVNETNKNKIIKIAELEVEGQSKEDSMQYVTFFMNGYNEIQMEISKKNIENICRDFKLNSIEELKDKKVNLVVKKNDKGYINYFIYAPQKFMNWDGDYQIPCTIFSYSKKLEDNCAIFGCKFRFNGEDYVDFIWYHLNNEWDQKYYQAFCKKAGLDPNAINPNLDIKAELKVSYVESKKEPGKFFTNKKLIIKK